MLTKEQQVEMMQSNNRNNKQLVQYNKDRQNNMSLLMHNQYLEEYETKIFKENKNSSKTTSLQSDKKQITTIECQLITVEVIIYKINRAKEPILYSTGSLLFVTLISKNDQQTSQ
jgi:hypothetical protein